MNMKAAYGNENAKAEPEAVRSDGKPPALLEEFAAIGHITVTSLRANAAQVDLASAPDPDPVRYGLHAAKLIYDFTGTDGTSAAYLNFKEADGTAGKPVEGYPLRIGLWVYGDGGKHWLRGQLLDGTGTKKPVDFTGAGELNWIGWKYVAADIPPGMQMPLRFTQLYVAETSNANKGAGAVYFSPLHAIYTDTGEDLEGPKFSGMKPEPEETVYRSDPEITVRIFDEGQGVDPDTIVFTLNGIVVPHRYDEATGETAHVPAAALADGAYTVTVDAADKAGNPALPGAVWSFVVYTGPDTEAPALRVISPMDGIRTQTNRPRLAIHVADRYTGVNAASIRLGLDGETVGHTYDEASGTLFYTPPVPLEPDSKHTASVTAADLAGNVSSVRWSFTVGAPLGQPANPDKFKMCVIGDGGYYTADQGRTASDILLREQILRINGEKPELVGYTGDIVENDTAANYEAALANMGLFEAPYTVSIGNHEVSGTGSRRNYQQTFGDPTYLYDYGHTRIIGLDSANNSITGSDASQWTWLRQVLEQTSQRHVIVFMHVPPDEISADGEHFQTGHGFSDPDDTARLYDLMGAFKTRRPDTNVVVFSGDLHAYLYKNVQGVDYVISGGGGKYTHIPPDKGGFYHYLNVYVDEASIRWDVVPLLDEITFGALAVRLGVNQEMTLTANGTFQTSTNHPITMPVAPPFKVEWSSDNPDAAEVDDLGKVTGKAPGTAAITVTCGNRHASAMIEVTDEPCAME
ncbi:Ig-like domain-containing protein [Paenibacillus sp. GCM10012303]|uniref:Ig-like domain-containing protein n=1 Tax=Paenibacillus sp. GCM10012303 TaxID=3317340 RepID=UPI0036186340